MFDKQMLREAFKVIGCTIRFRTYSDFISGIVYKDGKEMPTIFTPEQREFFQEAIELKNALKGKKFEGLYRIII